MLIVAAAALAALSLSLAALPLPALERLLSARTHRRTQHVAALVDRHRLDIVVVGVATLFVVSIVLASIVVALPAVAR